MHILSPQILPVPSTEKNDWPWSVPPDLSKSHAFGQLWPKITIVTPSYNQGAFLEKTIRSVLLQGYPNLEYIIIDGGSTDESVEIIKKYGPYLTHWVSEKDRGQSHAINKGMELSSGELLGWLNSDDYFLPGTLFRLARAYMEDPSVGAIYGQGHIVNQDETVIYMPKLVQVTRESLFDWCFGNDFMQPSCLFTQQAWRAVGPIDETLNFALDVDFWIRIADKFVFRQLPDVLSISLSHPLAKTTSMRNRSHAELALVCMKYGKQASATRILDRILTKHEALEREINNYQTRPLTMAIRHVLRKLFRY